MKTTFRLLLAFITLSVYGQEQSINRYSILPQPFEVQYETGEYHFNYDFSFTYPSALLSEALMARNWLMDDFKMSPVLHQQKDGVKKGAINFQLDEAVLPSHKEGYILQVADDGITIKANSSAGILYGVQSLRQIIKSEGDHFVVQKGTITDYPALGWRAFMLDEARHFKGKEVVKNLLNEMVQLKMNVFHWHLVDDQGWRIEIKKYPRLTEIGAFRDSTEINHFHSDIFDGKPHGGFYSQEDIKDIIQYASERNIMIVPEIEMPGHASASIAAYPWLGAINKQIKVPGYFGVMYDVYDVTNPNTIDFLHEVLEEVIALFPAPVIHIGGDEVRYNQWKESKSVQAYMKQHKLNTPAELQVHFTNNMSNWISKKGKKMMGWNEITGEQLHDYQSKSDTHMEQRLAPETIVHFWKGNPALINQTIDKGYHIVNSFHEFTYLDYSYQSIPLEKAYAFSPVPVGLDKAKEKYVLGLGCQMWCEFVPDVKSMNKKVFPRIAAYAENGWTVPENKNYEKFLEALQFFLSKWDKQGIEYGPVSKPLMKNK